MLIEKRRKRHENRNSFFFSRALPGRAPSTPPTHTMPHDDSRIVLHLDLDAFYAQVEAAAHSIPPTTPLAVRQWGGLIAVNYAARAEGVTRFQAIPDALKACPSLVLVHVQTLGDGGDRDAGTVNVPGGVPWTAGPSKAGRKACLARYREMSGRVAQVLRAAAPPGSVVEKASIDEFYVDATPGVAAALGMDGGDGCAMAAAASAAGIDVGSTATTRAAVAAAAVATADAAPGAVPTPLNPANADDARLAVGASIAAALRGEVKRQLGLTSSAGVAHNKILAKIASARHKPNKQAVVPRWEAGALMAATPLGKVPGFGGKLGDALTAAGLATPTDVASAPLPTVAAALGGDLARATAVVATAAGESDAPVAEKAAPKSLTAAKSLDTPAPTAAALDRWLRILADELADRLADDGRPPRSLSLHYRRRGDGGAERSVSGPAPRGAGGSAPPSADALVTAAQALLARAGPAALPCSRVVLVAGDFAPPRATGTASIAHFFWWGGWRRGVRGGGGGGTRGRTHRRAPAVAPPTTRARCLHPFCGRPGRRGRGGAGPATARF